MDARRSLSFVAVLAVAFGPGCISDSGPSPGFEAWEFTNAQYVGVVGGSVDKAWGATLAALDQLGLRVKNKTRERLRADISAVEHDGTSVQIALSRQSPDFTRVTIQVGVLGDQGRSKAIVAAIKANL